MASHCNVVVLVVVVRGHGGQPMCFCSRLFLGLLANRDGCRGILFMPINTICTIQVGHQLNQSKQAACAYFFLRTLLLYCNSLLQILIFRSSLVC